MSSRGRGGSRGGGRGRGRGFHQRGRGGRGGDRGAGPRRGGEGFERPPRGHPDAPKEKKPVMKTIAIPDTPEVIQHINLKQILDSSERKERPFSEEEREAKVKKLRQLVGSSVFREEIEQLMDDCDWDEARAADLFYSKKGTTEWKDVSKKDKATGRDRKRPTHPVVRRRRFDMDDDDEDHMLAAKRKAQKEKIKAAKTAFVEPPPKSIHITRKPAVIGGVSFAEMLKKQQEKEEQRRAASKMVELQEMPASVPEYEQDISEIEEERVVENVLDDKQQIIEDIIEQEEEVLEQDSIVEGTEELRLEESMQKADDVQEVQEKSALDGVQFSSLMESHLDRPVRLPSESEALPLSLQFGFQDTDRLEEEEIEVQEIEPSTVVEEVPKEEESIVSSVPVVPQPSVEVEKVVPKPQPAVTPSVFPSREVEVQTSEAQTSPESVATELPKEPVATTSAPPAPVTGGMPMQQFPPFGVHPTGAGGPTSGGAGMMYYPMYYPYMHNPFMYSQPSGPPHMSHPAGQKPSGKYHGGAPYGAGGYPQYPFDMSADPMYMYSQPGMPGGTSGMGESAHHGMGGGKAPTSVPASAGGSGSKPHHMGGSHAPHHGPPMNMGMGMGMGMYEMPPYGGPPHYGGGAPGGYGAGGPGGYGSGGPGGYGAGGPGGYGAGGPGGYGSGAPYGGGSSKFPSRPPHDSTYYGGGFAGGRS